LSDGLSEIYRSSLKDDLASHDPGHIEEIIDEAGKMLNLPADNAPGPLLSFLLRIESIKHGEATHDRRERVAELVPQHGQEVILGLADSLGFGAGRTKFRHDSLAHPQVVPRIVLPSASPERGSDGRDQGGGSNRALQEAHISVRSEQLERAHIRASRLSRGRDDHQG